jgi:amidase
MISWQTWSRRSPDAGVSPEDALAAESVRTDTETWVGATAKQIARAVRRGDASAAEVVADHLEHIAARGAVTGALRVVREGEALAEADAVDAQEELVNLPLAGVPVAVKETTPIAGLPTWQGSAATRSPAPAALDHEVVHRLRGAGAVVVATTRSPELALWAFTDDADGTARNPWRTDRTPGGSSGGAAAAVAAGLVPIAHGTDGLGSIRIPAATCGLVGIKPGRGVVPSDMGANSWFGLSEHGILATTVGDATVGLAVLAGWTPSPQLAPPDRLRVAVSTRSPVAGIFPDSASRQAVRSATRLLEAAGHQTVKRSPTYPTRLGPRVIATWCAGAFSDVEHEGIDPSTLQPRSRRHVALGQIAMRRGYVQEEHRAAWRAKCEAWFGDHGIDVLVTPAVATTPPAAAAWHERSWFANVRASMRFAPYAAPWNVAGFPAMAVPMGVRPDGLPVAVQLVGPPGSELRLLAVAGQLEEASPWLRHAPGWPYPGAAG